MIPPPPFKAFFSRPLVPLLIWAPGPKCLGVKTDSRRGRGGFRSPQPPFPLLLPSASQSCSHPTTSPPPRPPAPQPPNPPARNTGRGSLPRTPPAPSPAPPGEGAPNRVWLVLSRGPGKLPSSAPRPNRRPGMQGQMVPSRKEGGLGATTARSPGRGGPPRLRISRTLMLAHCT